MARRRRPERREVVLDPKFGNPVVSKFMCSLMKDGKKSVAERIFYGAIDLLQTNHKGDPLDLFLEALGQVEPEVEVRSRRVGGATYQVPVEVRSRRRQALGIRWMISAASKRSEKTMVERLAHEILDASQGRGGAFKKKEDVHRMAEANRAFSHYRW